MPKTDKYDNPYQQLAREMRALGAPRVVEIKVTKHNARRLDEPNRAARRKAQAAVGGTHASRHTKDERALVKFVDRAGTSCVKVRPKRVRKALERAEVLRWRELGRP